MAESGYIDWTPGDGTGGLLFDKPWFGGQFTDKQMMSGLAFSERITQRLVEHHSGNHTRVGTYRGDKAPVQYSHYSFSFTWRHKYNDDYKLLRALFAAGATFSFAVGLRATDVFDATDGDTYTLSRPVAAGVVTGVTTSTHPHVVYLDGSVDANAASINQQTVTANDTGTIRVEYTPVFQVEFTSFDSSINDSNIFDTSIGLTESIEGDFS